MPCVRDDLVQPVCLTIVYNIYTGALISSTLECGECTEGTEFDFETKNLTIRVPFAVEGILTINDNFQASCVTKNVSLIPPQNPQQPILIQDKKDKEKKKKK